MPYPGRRLRRKCPRVARYSKRVDAETTATWLIGLGALTIVAGLVVGSERPYEGMTFRGPFNTPADRLRFAIEATGALSVATGSVLLAIVHPPSPVLLLVVLGGYAFVHGLCAWKLLQYWQHRRERAIQATRGEGVTELQHKMADCARTCATWRWCLRHPFNGEYWPKSARSWSRPEQPD
jgi:hypothetical protein